MALLNSRPTPKFYKPTRLFVQVYITFYSLKFKLMNFMLKMMNIITKCHERKRKEFSVIIAPIISKTLRHEII